MGDAKYWDASREVAEFHHQGNMTKEVVSVPVLPLPEVLRSQGVSLHDVSFVKVDCEGCEWALRTAAGMWDAVESGRITLASELHRARRNLQDDSSWEALV